MTDSLTQKLDRMAEGLTRWPFKNWNFGDSVGFESLLVASKATGNPRWEEFATAWFRSWATRAEPFVRLDCTAPGVAMVQVARKTGDPVLVEALTNLATYLRQRPLLQGAYETWESSPLLPSYGPSPMEEWEKELLSSPPAGVFLDCLHFDPPFFTSLGALLDDKDLIFEGVSQAVAYCDILQTSAGLFDHFILRGVQGTFGPGWGRGQGWALLGLLDTIEFASPYASKVPKLTDSIRKLTTSLQRLAQAQVEYQRDDGHWSAVVTDSDSGVESSTAAFMAHGFSRGRKLGLLDDSVFAIPTARALEAVEESLGVEGNLSQVSAAVFACTSAEHYSFVPRNRIVPWGQGPALMALADQMDD